MNGEHARPSSASGWRLKQLLLGSTCALALGLATPAGSWAAPAKHKLTRKHPEQVSKQPFGDIPKGPLEIFVSVDQQRLHFYSGGVHVADEPVATGVPGHLTPLGVFSVIQRDRYHHSNIYDNAPMPFMERITWSGVALHEGVGLGHQASHGCVRMPHDFAARLWLLPTLGMRVIIARPELKPADFADSHLFVHKLSTSASAGPAPVQTAQASVPSIKTDVIDSSAGGATPPPATAPSTTPPSAPPTGTADTPSTSPAAPTLSEIIKTAETAATQPKPTTEAPPTLTAGTTPDATAPKPPAPPPTTPDTAGTTKPPSTLPTQPTPPTASTPPTPPVAPPTTANLPTPNITTPISLDDVPLPLSKPPRLAGGNRGPIAIFVSRKTQKIYVRQDFAPLFDAAIKIDNPDQPIGTHVFTALDYMPDHSTLRWTVTTLPPTPPRQVEHWKSVKDGHGQIRRERVVEHVDAPQTPPETPQEALARLEIPQDVIDQISRLIVPGSSLVVSDQGLGPETGEGTDFIVVTR